MPEYSFDFIVRGYHDFEDGMGDDFEDAAGPAPWGVDAPERQIIQRSLGVRW